MQVGKQCMIDDDDFCFPESQNQLFKFFRSKEENYTVLEIKVLEVAYPRPAAISSPCGNGAVFLVSTPTSACSPSQPCPCWDTAPGSFQPSTCGYFGCRSTVNFSTWECQHLLGKPLGFAQPGHGNAESLSSKARNSNQQPMPESSAPAPGTLQPVQEVFLSRRCSHYPKPWQQRCHSERCNLIAL